MESKGPKLDIKKIEGFEAEIGYRLPEDYRQFLLENNGGRPHPPYYFNVPGWQHSQSLVNDFKGIVSDNEGYGISQVLEIKGDVFPKGFIPIGRDPGGNHILMSLTESTRGEIYFWDHEDSPDTQLNSVKDYTNIYPLADSFESFVNSLKHEDEL